VKAKPAKVDSPSAASVSTHPLARRRVLAGTVLAVVAFCTLGGRAIWELAGPTVIGRERYLLQADKVVISDLPEWTVADVRGQVIQNSGLAGRLSVLDKGFSTKVASAFELHPWVESVKQITKRPPAGVFVELVYRRPVAVIEAPHGESSELLPIDAHAILLPPDDVPLIRRSYLPRITGVLNQPPAGQRWDDPRVAGAIDLAVRMADDWDALSLVEISPSARPEIQPDRRYFVYDMVTRGGTRIVWGAPPMEGVPGEDDFAVKLGRLKQCVAQYATLDWTQWPAIVDVRRGTAVTPRTAKKSAAGAEEPVVAERPEVVAEKMEQGDDEQVVK
jgi:hypothetical protein